MDDEQSHYFTTDASTERNDKSDFFSDWYNLLLMNFINRILKLHSLNVRNIRNRNTT